MLDKVGRLFLIGPSNHNLAKLESVDLTFFPLLSLNQECRVGGRGSQDKAATAGVLLCWSGREVATCPGSQAERGVAWSFAAISGLSGASETGPE